MKRNLILGVAMAGIFGAFQAQATEGAEYRLGSTLTKLGGDISSSGDGARAEGSALVEKVQGKFERDTWIHCSVAGTPYSIELTGSFDSFSNRGAVRVTKPKPTGGAPLTVYLETYERAVHIDPITNAVKVRVWSNYAGAPTPDGEETVEPGVALYFVLRPGDGKLEFDFSSVSTYLPNLKLSGQSDRSEVLCGFGAPAKRRFD